MTPQQAAQVQMDTLAKQMGFASYHAWQVSHHECYEGVVPVCSVSDWGARFVADLAAHGIHILAQDFSDLVDATSRAVAKTSTGGWLWGAAALLGVAVAFKKGK